MSQESQRILRELSGSLHEELQGEIFILCKHKAEEGFSFLFYFKYMQVSDHLIFQCFTCFFPSFMKASIVFVGEPAELGLLLIYFCIKSIFGYFEAPRLKVV